MDAVTQSRPVNPLKSLVVVAIFTALSAAGGLIKFPSPVGSIAFDSAPGYFVAGFFSPLLGGIAGAFGHIVSAGIAGFPLAVAHIPIAVMQFVWCFLFGFIIRRANSVPGLVGASVVAILANGVVAPLILGLIFPQFRSMLTTLIPFLLAASAINVIIAAVAVKFLSRLDIPGL